MMQQPLSQSDTLIRLQMMIVTALQMADQNGLGNVAIHLDEARLSIAEDIRQAGLNRHVLEVPAPNWP